MPRSGMRGWLVCTTHLQIFSTAASWAVSTGPLLEKSKRSLQANTTADQQQRPRIGICMMARVTRKPMTSPMHPTPRQKPSHTRHATANNNTQSTADRQLKPSAPLQPASPPTHLSGRTMDPFWSTWSPRVSRSAKLRTCVKVWLGTICPRRP